MEKVITIPDNFSIEEAADFREKLNDLIDKGQINFVLDFSNCSFIDSTGLGVLVSTYKRCKEKNGNLKIKSINNNQVLKVFTLTRLDKVFELDI